MGAVPVRAEVLRRQRGRRADRHGAVGDADRRLGGHQHVRVHAPRAALPGLGLHPPARRQRLRATGLADNEGFYLDIYDGAHAGPPNASSTPGRYSGAEIYYQYGPSRLGGYFLTYWFFYPYDQFLVSGTQTQAHEGDWERLVIRFDSSLRPLQAAYHHHDCYQVLSWGSVQKSATTHPVAFVARGSHGIWLGAGGRCHSYVPNDSTDTGAGLRWYTWTGSVAWVRSRGFYGFGGAWGNVGQFSDTTGPLGPSRYKKYAEPF